MKHIRIFNDSPYISLGLADRDVSLFIDPETRDIFLDEGAGDDRLNGVVFFADKGPNFLIVPYIHTYSLELHYRDIQYSLGEFSNVDLTRAEEWVRKANALVSQSPKRFLLVDDEKKVDPWQPMLQEAVSSLGLLKTVLEEQAVEHIIQQEYDWIMINASYVLNVTRMIFAIMDHKPTAKIIVSTPQQAWEETCTIIRAGALDCIDQRTSAAALRRIFVGTSNPFESLLQGVGGNHAPRGYLVG